MSNQFAGAGAVCICFSIIWQIIGALIWFEASWGWRREEERRGAEEIEIGKTWHHQIGVIFVAGDAVISSAIVLFIISKTSSNYLSLPPLIGVFFSKHPVLFWFTALFSASVPIIKLRSFWCKHEKTYASSRAPNMTWQQQLRQLFNILLMTHSARQSCKGVSPRSNSNGCN